MSNLGHQLDRLKNVPKPWVVMFDWPEPVGASPDTIRAALFAGEASRKYQEGLIVRKDGRFLGLIKFGKLWRVSAGDFVGTGSIIDSQVVRTDPRGRSAAPKQSLLKLLTASNGAECTWPEAAAIGLHFIGLASMPVGFAWWKGKEGS